MAAAMTPGLVLLPGCGGKRSNATAEIANASTALASLQSLREDLADGQSRLFTMAETIRQATAPQDLSLSPWFVEYQEQREGVRLLAVSLREGFDELQQAERVYIQQWEQDLAAIGDRRLREQSVQRRATLRDSFGTLRNELDDTKQKFQPFLRTLSDLEVYLQNDLTSTGVQQVSDRLSSSALESENLGQRVSADLARLDELIAELAPVKN